MMLVCLQWCLFEVLFFLPNRPMGRSRVSRRSCSVRHVRLEAFQTRLTQIFAVHIPRARGWDELWWLLARPRVIASVGTAFLGNHVSVGKPTQPRTQTKTHAGSVSKHTLTSSFLCFFSICRFRSAATQEFSTQSPCKKSEQGFAACLAQGF